jgi:hypothetical protein
LHLQLREELPLRQQSSPLSPDCDRESCKCEYYEEAEDDYRSYISAPTVRRQPDSAYKEWALVAESGKAQPHEHITHAVMDWIQESAPSSQEKK